MSISSFLRGMGSVINLFPQGGGTLLPNYSDEDAFKKDLEQVGNDMRFAINMIEQTNNDVKRVNEMHRGNDIERNAKF